MGDDPNAAMTMRSSRSYHEAVLAAVATVAEAPVLAASVAADEPDSKSIPSPGKFRRLKRAAFNGGLNCSKCVGQENGKPVSCADAPVCEEMDSAQVSQEFCDRP